MQILKLMPAGKDYLWGGTRLRKEYRKKIDLIPLAETWECSVHPDGLSMERFISIQMDMSGCVLSGLIRSESTGKYLSR